MTKQNLFSLLAFFSAVGWLQIFEVKTGLFFALWILIANVGLNMLYSLCKDDPKDDE